MSKSAFIIDRVTHPNGHQGYVVLDPGTKSGKEMLDRGMVVPCQMTREDAVRQCGETRVAAFDKMIEEAKLGDCDFRLTRYPRPQLAGNV